MPIGEPPPLHPDAITVAKIAGSHETIETIDTGKIQGIQGTPFKFHPESNPRFPTCGLEPFQIQRAEALERAHRILGKDAMTEDIIRAASFIECGRLPDG